MKEAVFDQKKVCIMTTGNTGAEIGALAGAKTVGLQTGGIALKDWMTEVGPQQEVLSNYGLTEGKYASAEKLTGMMAKKANVTIIFLQFYHMPETLNALVSCDDLRKPVLPINPYREDAAEQVVAFLEKHKPKSVFVTGNREGKTPGMAKQVFNLFKVLFGEGVSEEAIPDETVTVEEATLES